MVKKDIWMIKVDYCGIKQTICGKENVVRFINNHNKFFGTEAAKAARQKKRDERFARAQRAARLFADWNLPAPIFCLEVATGHSSLFNTTGYSVNSDHASKEKLQEYMRTFNMNNIVEGGKGIKRIITVLYSNTCDYDLGAFTDGWVPKQDKDDIDKNTCLAYLVEFDKCEDVTGWMRWVDYLSAEAAVHNAVNPLLMLSECKSCREDMRKALEQCIAAKNQIRR
jgi:hypothetical protein